MAAIVARCERATVGLRRHAEVLAVALAEGQHVVLEGPPGTGKSTLLRAVAEGAGLGLHFVEGHAELTPPRLLGGFDPAVVLRAGYAPEAFLEGPLVVALREGGLLYLEELNRIPEETINVLLTALAEGEVHVPRLGEVRAAPGFRMVAAMNPYDAVGTARVAEAVYDRVCRIAVGYQDARAEERIVALRAARPVGALVADLLALRGAGATDLALALGVAARTLAATDAQERVTLLLSDCTATTGADPLPAAAALDRLHVLGTDPDPVPGRALAAAGRGRYAPAGSVADLTGALPALLE